MANAAEIAKALKKEHGASIVTKGMEGWEDCVRIPTGIFPLDLLSGGGFPMGKVSIIFGPESSNKTNIALLALANCQKMYPDKVCVFVDVEFSFDPVWATTLGVDVDKLLVLHPEYAEQAVDLTESFLYADDVAMVVLDSIAALTTQNEIVSSAEKASVGGASLVIGKLFRKAAVSFQKMKNAGMSPPAFIAINQIRHKIGVMFGDPETMPGGNPPKFAASFIVRVYGKSVIDPKIDAVLPAWKETTIIMRKWKVPILAVKGEFKLLMLDRNGKKPGWCDDWNTISTYLKELNYLSKGEKAGWVLFGDPYKTLDECRSKLYGDETLLRETKAQIIKDMLEKGSIAPTKGVAEAEETEV